MTNITPPWAKPAPASAAKPWAKPPKPAKTGPVDILLPAYTKDKDIGLNTKLRYEEFAKQYVIDFNATRASVRMGYDREVASTVGNAMFWHPYTQAYLITLIRSMDEGTICHRNDVLAGLLREANNYGEDASSATRIVAWREIGKLMGMYIARVEISANSSGVMQVPMVVNDDQWERMSAQSQGALMAAVRS